MDSISLLLPALDVDSVKLYSSGKFTVKALHDGNEVFFMLQVDGDYAYTRLLYARLEPQIAMRIVENITQMVCVMTPPSIGLHTNLRKTTSLIDIYIYIYI
ncbi:hypothetical protein TEA_021770 [Camellia sinensis var. sinensis]|uniref:Uncharacterized protein n=1 Tax=Camellia sinensis var. sinensis TaxID=542762 RepID=A0A4V3WPD6_CAMSN|nr:hypothetical protein TEA_021770 [Camellia sinensis var. sinensis]